LKLVQGLIRPTVNARCVMLQSIVVCNSHRSFAVTGRFDYAKSLSLCLMNQHKELLCMYIGAYVYVCTYAQGTCRVTATPALTLAQGWPHEAIATANLPAAPIIRLC
jgi:hypothetical protein